MSLSDRIAQRKRADLVAAKPELARCTCSINAMTRGYHERGVGCPFSYAFSLPAKDMTDRS